MSRLSLSLLGPSRIEFEGMAVQVDTRKAIAMLAYLAVTGESHRRDALVNLLWPELDRTRGRAALRRTLSTLRRALHDTCLDVDRESIGLHPDADSWLDVEHFRGYLARCRAHGHAPPKACPECLPLLADAVALYRGDFLSGFTLRDSLNFDDWQFYQTDALRREAVDAVAKLVHGHSVEGALDLALRYTRKWLAIDRLDEEAHSQLMRLYAWTGQRSAALRQYEQCIQLLQEQLAVTPQAETTALYEAIKEGHAVHSPDRASAMYPVAQGAEAMHPASSAAAEPVRGEKRMMTALFVDASAALGRIGNVSPEDEAPLVRRGLDLMKQILSRYGGEIHRTLGRSVLIIFGITQTHESDPELAIRAAIEIRREGRRLDLSTAMGLGTGESYYRAADTAGNGTSTLLGSAIDRAMRLAGKAQPGQILVGEATYRLARRAFSFTPLAVAIEGTGGSIRAYQVDRPLAQPQKVRGIEGLRAELVGRDRELAQLKEALGRVLQGQGQMVALIGEAGIGKSRLIVELRTHTLADSRGSPAPLWLEGRCLELGTAAGYGPFIDILQGYFAWLGTESELGRGQRIAASLGGLVERGTLSAGQAQEIGPALGHLLSARFGGNWDDRLADCRPDQVRQRTFAAIRGLLHALARRQPVVLVLEDLHWADNSSLDLISLLMDGLHLAPILLLCAYRPERKHRSRHLTTIARQKCDGRHTEIRLAELTHSQSQRLITSLLSTTTLPASTQQLVLGQAQGNPFYIEEVVRSLIDAQILYHDGDTWRVQEEVDPLTVPETIQSVILSRLDRLPRRLQQTLQLASVIGRAFPHQVLERASNQRLSLEDVLWELEDRDLIYQERVVPEVEYAFKHVLMQETAYHSILRDVREGFHRRVAEAVEFLRRDNLDEFYEQLAHHYEESGDTEQAAAYLFEAGEKAKRRYANEEAIAHLTRALKLLKTVPETPERNRRELDLQIALGVPLIHIRGHAAIEVKTAYSRAIELCAQIGEVPQRLQALVGLRRFHLLRGEFWTAQALSDQILTAAQKAGDLLHVSWAHLMQGEVLYWLGEFPTAREHFARGVTLCDSLPRHCHVAVYGNDAEIGCRCLGALSAWHLGCPDQALAMSEKGLEQAQALAYPFILTFALYLSGMLHRLRREVTAAREHAEAVLRICAAHDFALFAAWAKILRGWALAQQGRVYEGIDQMQEGIAAWQDGKAAMALPSSIASLAEAYGQAGELEEALRLLDGALALVDRNGERCWEAELHRLKGELLLAHAVADTDDEANLQDAADCFRRAIEVARSQNAKLWELRAATNLARLWHRQDRTTEARELLRGIYNWFSEGLSTADLREALALLDEMN